MLKKILVLLMLSYICNNKIIANNSNIAQLEKRIIYLEKQVAELKNESKDRSLNDKWRRLKKGIKKINIKNDIGNPDRIGKYSNGDEIWGFEDFTLKFDKNGNLKNWTKPFLP
tara:strand:+ start:233 stop:571 length:339 start_codon:yes stop_codon:yes gene_type:complete